MGQGVPEEAAMYEDRSRREALGRVTSSYIPQDAQPKVKRYLQDCACFLLHVGREHSFLDIPDTDTRGMPLGTLHGTMWF